jgi:hypothetical protein
MLTLNNEPIKLQLFEKCNFNLRRSELPMPGHGPATNVQASFARNVQGFSIFSRLGPLNQQLFNISKKLVLHVLCKLRRLHLILKNQQAILCILNDYEMFVLVYFGKAAVCLHTLYYVCQNHLRQVSL